MKKVYAIRDDVAKVFSNPIYFLSDELFRRELLNLIAVDDKHPYSLNPCDYVVYYLGLYDDSNGTFELLKYPERKFSIAELSDNL